MRASREAIRELAQAINRHVRYKKQRPLIKRYLVHGVPKYEDGKRTADYINNVEVTELTLRTCRKVKTACYVKLSRLWKHKIAKVMARAVSAFAIGWTEGSQRFGLGRLEADIPGARYGHRLRGYSKWRGVHPTGSRHIYGAPGVLRMGKRFPVEHVQWVFTHMSVASVWTDEWLKEQLRARYEGQADDAKINEVAFRIIFFESEAK